jgi:hypothetical protein
VFGRFCEEALNFGAVISVLTGFRPKINELLNTEFEYHPSNRSGASEAHIFFFFHWLYSPIGPRSLIFQFHNHFTDGRTPRTPGQLVARPLPKHRTTQTQNKHIDITNIYALFGIRTHDPGFRASMP